MTFNQTGRHKDLGLLIIRVGFGLGFLVFHGLPKLMGGPEVWSQVGGAMEFLGIAFGHTVFGFLASLIEALGGLMLAAGLFFRPVSLLLGLTMIVAAVSMVGSDMGSPSHAVKNMFLFAGLMFVGPGKYSLDHRWFK